MGAKVKSGFIFLGLILAIFMFGLFGCGDIYKNMKISVDTSEVVLYLNGEEDETSAKQIKATISGINNNKISKNVEAVFDDSKIASASEINYSGNDAIVTISASAPGTTFLRIKSLDNSEISSESIQVKVVERIEEINVSSVVASASTSQQIDLALLPQISFNPVTTSETDLEFYFSDGMGGGIDSNVFGQIVDKHILHVAPSAKLGFCEIVVKSSKLQGFDSSSKLQKTFDVLIYKEFNQDDIVVSKYSEKDSKYVETENLVLVSNYVEAPKTSIEEKILITLKDGFVEEIKDNYKFSIIETAQTTKGVVKAERSAKLDEFNVFVLTPIQTGKTVLEIQVSIERDGKVYVLKTKQLEIEVTAVVKKIEIETEDAIVLYNLDDAHATEVANISVFESGEYNGIMGTEIHVKTSPQNVANQKFKIHLGSGHLNDGTTILADKFKQYIHISDNFSDVDYEETEFLPNSYLYVSYDKSINDEGSTAADLSEFEIFVVTNYEDGLKRFEAKIVCTIFKSVEGMSFVDDKTSYIVEKGNSLKVSFKAETNIDLSLINVYYNKTHLNLLADKEYKKEEDEISGEIVENKKIVEILFEATNVGSSDLSVVEKYTQKIITIPVVVVVLNDVVYLTVDDKQTGMGMVENETSDGVTQAKNIYCESGSSFDIKINTTTPDATFAYVRISSTDENNLLSRNFVYDQEQNIVRVSTSYVNYAPYISDPSTFAHLSVEVAFYKQDGEQISVVESGLSLNVGTYKKLVEFSFNNFKTEKDVQIYDRSVLSIENQNTENVGFVEIKPYLEIAYGSTYEYKLEDYVVIADDIDDNIWHISYVDPSDKLQGISVYTTGILTSQTIRIQFEVKEFSHSYYIWCNITSSIPQNQIESVSVPTRPVEGEEGVFEPIPLYVENWDNSNYNMAQIDVSISPSNVFDKNLSYVVLETKATDLSVMVYDNTANELKNRFSDSLQLTLIKKDDQIWARCGSGVDLTASYSVVVLPSYLLNFEDNGNTEEYKTKIKNLINDDSLKLVCKIIPIEISSGSVVKPYKVGSQSDLKQFLKTIDVNKNGNYFEIENDIKLDMTDWEEYELNANLSSKDNVYSIYGITKPVFSKINSNAKLSKISFYYEMSDETVFETNNFAIVALENFGTISEVNFAPNMLDDKIVLKQNDANSEMFVGGLVSKNSGTITNCFGQVSFEIELVSTEQNLIVGGVVAQNDGSIKIEGTDAYGTNLNVMTFITAIEVKVPTKTEALDGYYYLDNGNYIKITETNRSEALEKPIYEAMPKSFIGGFVGVNNRLIDSSSYVSSSVNKLSNIDIQTEIVAPLCDNVGGIAGRNKSVIRGVLVSSKIDALDNVGGAVGIMDSPTLITGYERNLLYVLSEFYNNRVDKTSIYANENVGGLVGNSSNAKIEACYVTSYVTGYNVVGTDVSLRSGVNEFYGDICAKNNVGGLVGKAYKTTINHAYTSVCLGLNSDQNAVMGGFVGTMTSSAAGTITNSYSISTLNANVDKTKQNKLAQFVGYLDLEGSENSGIINGCYSVTNGGNLLDTYLAENEIVVIDGKEYKLKDDKIVTNDINETELSVEYSFELNADKLYSVSTKVLFEKFVNTSENRENFSECQNCYYADLKKETGDTTVNNINVRQNIEMKSLFLGSTYWSIVETANGGYPIIKLSFDGQSFNLYNTQIGSIKVDRYESDNVELSGLPLPRFKRFDDGKVIVVLDMIYKKSGQIGSYDLSLWDILKLDLESGANYSELEVCSHDTNILQIQSGQNEESEKRFKLKFLKTGTVKVSVQYKKNTAISTTFQICVVGGFSDFEISNDEIFVDKGGANDVVVSFVQNSPDFYDDTNVVSINLVSSSETDSDGYVSNVLINGKSLKESEPSSDFDLTLQKVLILSGVGSSGSESEFSIVPYLTIGFFNDSGVLEYTKLLVKGDVNLNSNIEAKTFKATVFEGVYDVKLNEENASIKNSDKIDISLNLYSDAIDDIEDRIKSDPDAFKIIINQDGEIIDDVLVNWENNTISYTNAKGRQVIPFSSFKTLTDVKAGYFTLSFSLEHEKNRMTQNEIEVWQFLFTNQDGSQKGATLSVEWEPSQIETVELLHFINRDDFISSYSEYGVEESTTKIASGSAGMLRIEVTQSYSDYDYLIVKGTSSVDEISFARYVEVVTSTSPLKRELQSDNGLKSESLSDGSIKLIRDVDCDNGIYYLSTLTAIGLLENTKFSIVVSAYKVVENGPDELKKTETLELYSAFAPFVNFSVTNDYARVLDGAIVARGTELKVDMFGVLQNSTVEVTLTGMVSYDDYLTSSVLSWSESGKYSNAQTMSSFNSSLTIYVGLLATATGDDGKLVLTVTVRSPGFSTQNSINVYIVDYLVKDLSVENTVDDVYNIKIQDGFKPLKLRLNTDFGEFVINSDEEDNLSKALEMANRYFTVSSDDTNFSNAYKAITQKIISKTKELNSLGTIGGTTTSTIWRYGNGTLNLSGSYSYFFLKVDNKLKNTNVVAIKGKEEVGFSLSVSLHRGIKLSSVDSSYEFILQNTSITENFLGVSSGDYKYEFMINFINSSSSDLPIPISTAEELRNMTENSHYILTKDITVTNWSPLSTKIGSLDGNGYKIIIKNYDITTTTSSGAPLSSLNAGLFSSISTYYDSKTQSVQPTRLLNIVLDISQTISINLGSATGVNFGFLVGLNDGGVIYNCEVISGVSNTRARLSLDSDTEVEVVAGITKVYENLTDVTSHSYLKIEDYIGKYYKYDKYIQITAVDKTNKKFILSNGDEILALADGILVTDVYETSDKINYYKMEQKSDISEYINNYVKLVQNVKISNVDDESNNVSKNFEIFGYKEWKNLYEDDILPLSFNAYTEKLLKELKFSSEEETDTTAVFIISNANITNDNIINIGGLVGTNNGYITNSRIGRLENVLTTQSKGRLGVDDNDDGVVDNLMVEYGLSIFGTGRFGGLCSVNNGVISACYVKNSNLINALDITNNQNICVGGLVCYNNGNINSSYVESDKKEITKSGNQYVINGKTYVYNSEASTISYNGTVVAFVLDGVFVLDGAEYTISGNKLEFIRKTQNKIYFSGEIGGFVHTNDGEIENSYSNIGLNSTLSVGGFVYNNRLVSSKVLYCYTACAIDNENIINGPFVGSSKSIEIYNKGQIFDSYYLFDSAIKKNSSEVASALDGDNLCSSTSLLLGFVFEDSNKTFTGYKTGVWSLNTTNEFEGPMLVEANKIAYSRREAVLDVTEMGTSEISYENTNFGDVENPRIVYSIESFNEINGTQSDDKNVVENDNIRIVANIDFKDQNPMIRDRVSSKYGLFKTNIQGNGMMLDNLNIVSDEDESISKYLGLFKTIENSTVSNLKLKISAFDGTMTTFAGALCGYCGEYSYVDNIKVEADSLNASISGRHIVGGVIGYVYGAYTKISNLESSISVNSTYDVEKGSAKFVSIIDGKIANENEVSYVGGIVGAVVTDSSSYKSSILTNCEINGDFVLKAEVVGGVVGFVSKNSSINACRLILNVDEQNQELQSGTIAGGIVGENRGLILYSYVELPKSTQISSDKTFSFDGIVGNQSGTENLFTGEDNVLGGLVGLNVGTNEKDASKYSGAIRFSYSRVKVVNDNALAAGGVVGLAVASVNELGSMAAVSGIVSSTYTRSYGTIVEGGNFIQTIDGIEVCNQSLFLYGVYTTGVVRAKNVAGGLVGVATALISAMKADATNGAVVSLPSDVSTSNTNYAGFVIGKANYRAIKQVNLQNKYVFFTQDGCGPTFQGISTIGLNSTTKIVGGIQNSELDAENYLSRKNDQSEELVVYNNLAEVTNSISNMQLAFNFFWEDGETEFSVDNTQSKFIFPRLSSGLKIITNSITTVQEYLSVVESGVVGNYTISQDLEFDFDSSDLININGQEKTLLNWFKTLYSEEGPSGIITGASTATGSSIQIKILGNSGGIPFFGTNVKNLSVANINFVVKGDINVSPADETSLSTDNLSWGMLACSFSNCSLSNVFLKFEDGTILIDKFAHIGGICGESVNSTFKSVTVSGFVFQNNSYTIREFRKDGNNFKALYVGGINGKSSKDEFSGVSIQNCELTIKASEITDYSGYRIYAGGITGYAVGDYYRFNIYSLGSTIEATINIDSKVEETYVGGVVGYVNTINPNSLNKINANVNIDVSGKRVFVGGIAGELTKTSLLNNSVTGNISVDSKSSIKVDDSIFVGGLVGQIYLTILETQNTLTSNGEIQYNSTSLNQTVNVLGDKQKTFVGGLVGQTIFNYNQAGQTISADEYVEIFKLNQTTGTINVIGDDEKDQTLYCGGLFGEIFINGTTAKNKIGISKMSNDSFISVLDFKKAYVAGIVASSDVVIAYAENTGTLYNNYTGTVDENCLSVMAGIVSKTKQRLYNCLSLGTIYEPNFVAVTKMEGITTKTIQISWAQAIVADLTSLNAEDEADQNVLNNCYYSSDFVGLNQDTDFVSKTMNLSVSSLQNMNIQGYGNLNLTTGDMPYIIDLNMLNRTKIQTISNFNNLVSNKKYVLSRDVSVNNTISLDSLENVQIVGNNHVVTTNEKALFNEIPSTVLISSLQVVSSGNNINVTSDFGLLAIVNNGIISNCVVGALPSNELTTSVLTELSNGLSEKEFGQSDVGVLTLNINASNITVGALVATNNKVINNSFDYCDINFVNQNSVNVGSLVGSNNFKLSYSYSLGKFNIKSDLTKSEDQNKIGQVCGGNKYNSTLYTKQLFGYVDVLYENTESLFKQIGGVCGENENAEMFYVLQMSRTNNKFNGVALRLDVAALYGVSEYKNNNDTEYDTSVYDFNTKINCNFWLRNNNYNYGLFYLRINEQNCLTSNDVDAQIFEIENYAEFNILSSQPGKYIFVRDLKITEKLNLANNQNVSIDGNGHYLFSDNLINQGSETNVYTAFNITLSKDSEIKNVMYKFGETTFDETGNYTIAPLVYGVNGGKISNCAVVGSVIQKAGSGSFGGLTKTLSGDLENPGTIQKCFSAVNVSIKSTESYTIGGLVAEISNSVLIEESFVDANISILSDVSQNNLKTKVGGLVGQTNDSNSLRISSCYVSKNSSITSTTSSLNIYAGQFVGYSECSDIYSSNMLEYCIYEGVFMGEIESVSDVSHSGNVRPNSIKFDGLIEVSSNLVFGYARNSYEYDGLAFETVVANFDTTVGFQQFDESGNIDTTYFNLCYVVYINSIDEYDSNKYLDGSQKYVLATKTIKQVPYLKDVTPIDRRYGM